MKILTSDLRVSTSAGFNLSIPKFEVNSNEIIAVIGANGAGKTTFLEAMLGLRKTTHGTTSILNTQVSGLRSNKKYLRSLGVQLQGNKYANGLLISEIVYLHKAFYQSADQEVASAFGISELLKRDFDKLSRGQKQRVDLYMAFAHCPSIVFLDEPETGLDKQYSDSLKRVIAYNLEKTKDCSILFTTHIPESLSIATRVIILENGRISYDCNLPNDLDLHLGKHLHTLELNNAAVTGKVGETLRTLDGVKNVKSKNETLFVYSNNNISEKIINMFSGDIFKFSYKEIGVEDLFNLIG